MPDKTPHTGVPSTIGAEHPRHRRYRGRSSSERADERRGQLLSAALRLYGNLGFRATTVRGICREAGLTERYFYESFENSEELLCAVCSWSMERMRTRAREAVELADADPEQRLRASVAAYFEYVRANPGHARIVLFEMEGVSRASSEHLRREVARSASLLAQLHFDPLVVRPPDGQMPELLAQALLGALYQLAKEWTLSGFSRPEQTLTEQIRALYAGLIHGWTVPEA